MSDRTDPMYYEFEIQERETGEVKRVPYFCWWTHEASERGLRRMCDCQLGAFFSSTSHNTWKNFQSGSCTNFFAGAQHTYLKSNQCDHRPSRKYTVLRAHVGGDVHEIAASQEAA